MTTYYWIGLGGDDDWSNPANWSTTPPGTSGGSPGVPGPSDIAYVDDALAIDGSGATVKSAFFQDDTLHNGYVTTLLTGALTTTTDLSVQGDTANTTYYDLEVNSGGSLTASNGLAGDASVNIDDDGILEIDGGHFNETLGGVEVGARADGSLFISGGSATIANASTNAALTLGNTATGVGYVQVSGVGSTLTINGSGVNDGYAGQSALNVVDAAQVTVDDDLFLGSVDGAVGQVNVETDDALLTVASFVAVGEAGLGEMYIRGGGTAAFGSLDIAVQGTSGDAAEDSPSLVLVEGGGSTAADKPLNGVVSFAQTNNETATLTVVDGITVGDAGYGELYVGYEGFASGASLDIAVQPTSGVYAGSTLSNSITAGDPSFAEVEQGSLTIGGAITVGDAGYGELEVGDGGVVSGASLDVAKQQSSGAVGGSAAAGSATFGNPSYVIVNYATLSLSGEATIGDAGYGEMLIQSGAVVSAGSLDVAAQSTSGGYGATHSSGSVDTGSPSFVGMTGGTLTIANAALVGDGGYGGVNISAGSMTVGSLDIAVQSTSGETDAFDRSFVEVDDDASSLLVQMDAVVGDAGYGALTDFNGATTTIDGNLFVASQSTSGSFSANPAEDAPDFVTVSGSGSELTVDGSATIGYGGYGELDDSFGAKTTIAGGLFIADDATSGSFADAAPDVVEVDGTGASIAVAGATTIGVKGDGELLATGGGAFTTTSVYMTDGAINVDSASLVSIGMGTATVSTGVDVQSSGYIYGSGSVTGAIENDGEITAAGGVLQLDGAVAGVGADVIDAGSTLDFQAAVSGQYVDFNSTGALATLQLDAAAAPAAGATFSATVENFGNNDAIDLTGLTYKAGATAVVTGSNLAVTSDGVTENFTLSSPGATNFYARQDSGTGTIVTDTPPCYARGARILTARGEVAVEALVVGDLAVTASGALRPIVWIGHRNVDLSRHRRPERVNPVRIEAGALAPNIPVRDLVVSPEHALWLDEALVCAGELVNGATIRQEAWREVEYFHVELESHDILLAEGCPAESYLDCGNRNSFENGDGALALHPEWRPSADSRLFASPSQRARLKERLAERAAALGHASALAAHRAYEEARAQAPRDNFVRNPRGEGAVCGRIGEGGSAPAFWWCDAPPGVAVEIAGAGVEAGLPYVDIRFVGSAQGEGNCAIYPAPGTGIAAERGQDWTFSCHLRWVGGSYAGVRSLSLYFDEYGANGDYLDGVPRSLRPPGVDPLALQRVSATHCVRRRDARSLTGYVQARIEAGATVDLTLRVAGFQIERGDYPSGLRLPAEGAFRWLGGQRGAVRQTAEAA
jgi:hypothetical protein